IIPGTDKTIYIKDLFNSDFYNQENDIVFDLKIRYKPFIDNGITIDHRLSIFDSYHISFIINYNSGKTTNYRPYLTNLLSEDSLFDLYTINDSDSSDHIKNYYLCDNKINS